MIHRIHKYDPNHQNGAGSFLGYVDLCNGYINHNHVLENLIQAGIVSDTWFTHNQVGLTANGFTKSSKNIYVLYRRNPRAYLFVIYPIDELVSLKPSKNKLGFVNGMNFAETIALGGTTTFNSNNYISANNYAFTPQYVFTPQIILPAPVMDPAIEWPAAPAIQPVNEED